jgi:hypothetical protein
MNAGLENRTHVPRNQLILNEMRDPKLLALFLAPKTGCPFSNRLPD